MRAFFEEKQNTDELHEAVKRWLGVPYWHMGCSKNGVDCTKFVGLLYGELDLMTHIEEVYYPRDWMKHGKEQIMRDAFEYHLQAYMPRNLTYFVFEYLEGRELMPGDVLLMAPCRREIYSHSALFIGENKIVQALERKGVFTTDFGVYWREMTGQFIRIFYKD